MVYVPAVSEGISNLSGLLYTFVFKMSLSLLANKVVGGKKATLSGLLPEWETSQEVALTGSPSSGWS